MLSQSDAGVQAERLAAAHRGDWQPATHTPEALKTLLVDLGLSALARGNWDTVRLITVCLQGGGLRHV
jgi:hypothetical protein